MASPYERIDLLSISVKEGNVVLRIPKIFRHLFSMEVQSILKSVETPTVHNIVDFRKWSSNTVLIPANTPITLKNSPLLASFLDAYSIDDINQRNQRVNKAILEALNLELLFCNRRVLQATFNGDYTLVQGHENDMYDLNSYVTFAFTQDSILQLDQSGLVMQANILLSEMRARGLKKFRVLPNQYLLLTDISLEEREKCIKEPKYCFEWLQSRTPKRTKVNLLGTILFKKSVIEESHGMVNALCLLSETGFEISLEEIL
jgi:hypothetical protein